MHNHVMLSTNDLRNNSISRAGLEANFDILFCFYVGTEVTTMFTNLLHAFTKYFFGCNNLRTKKPVGCYF